MLITLPQMNVMLLCAWLLFWMYQYADADADPARSIRRKNATNTFSQRTLLNGESTTTSTASMPPNIVVFIVDDMGWNQVGYHAKPSGNDEIRTPHIDHYATEVGIELDRGYMTPWCGPSRAATMTGRTNVYNANVSSLISTFDDDIGYVAGLQPGTKTLATALKAYGKSINVTYSAWFNGKFGIGGTAFTNTPLGMGFDEFRGFWGTALEPCDGLATPIATVGTSIVFPTDKEFGQYLINALPGYFEQHPQFPDVDWCPFIKSVSGNILTSEEKFIACKTRPRKLSKLIDLDLLDKVVEQITRHDYTKGPILQYFSTALLHHPISYPTAYDVNASDRLPLYFQPGKVKPTPSNDDYRMTINQAVRYLDDVFGSTMQAIKDAGQWDNTIVYFTSDNGGPVYIASAMNNYPLRGSKFSPFEGGLRVVQFMTGGWINQNLPANRRYKSVTNLFPNDIAPTLLEMVGADVSFLLGNKKGAPYGNPMWKFIKNSLEPMPNASQPMQKVRKVAISKDVFFDVGSNRTLKNIYTGNIPVLVPRLWAPIYPKTGDLIMDTNYRSVMPCRPNGKPLDCCLLDVTNDFQERNPLPANCNAMELEGQNLFEIEGGCVKDATGKYPNVICLQPGDVDGGVLPSKLSLWSHIGAAGPFTNSKGVPIDGLPMKCICDRMADNVVNLDATTYFNLNIFTPTECNVETFFVRKPALAVPCKGKPRTIATLKTSALFNTLAKKGVDRTALDLIRVMEPRQLLPTILPAMSQSISSYLNRQGFVEWPNVFKWPHYYDDSCSAKKATAMATPPNTITPYSLGGKIEVTFPKSRGPLELCAAASTDSVFFCPSHQNPTFQNVEKWTFDRDSPQGIFSNGSIWKPYSLLECLARCPVSAQGTAYIGDGPFGIAV